MKYLTSVCVLTVCLFLCAGFVFADTIFLKDGSSIKGIVVEEYSDRVKISTFEGEKTVSKNKIKEIAHDLPEQNLLRLGDRYMGLGEFDKAYFYYEKAHKANPEFSIALEKMNYAKGYFFRKKQLNKQKNVQKKQELEDWPKPPYTYKDFEEDLVYHIGIRIGEEKNAIVVLEVIKNTPAFHAGLSRGDKIVSVWGKLTGYMSDTQVAELIQDESMGEIKLKIERDVLLQKEKLPKSLQAILGGKLDMLMDGLTVTELVKGGSGESAGLKEGDLIVSINGQPTRYMPLKDAVNIIESPANDVVDFTLRRGVTIWRE